MTCSILFLTTHSGMLEGIILYVYEAFSMNDDYDS
jgi:hypothetical protein